MLDRLKELMSRSMNALKSEDVDSLNGIQEELKKMVLLQMKMKLSEIMDIPPDQITNEQAEKLLDMHNQAFELAIQVTSNMGDNSGTINLN